MPRAPETVARGARSIRSRVPPRSRHAGQTCPPAARPSGLRGQHALDHGSSLLDVAVVQIEMRHEAHGPRAFVEAEHARLADDQRRARTLAARLAALPGLEIDLA